MTTTNLDTRIAQLRDLVPSLDDRSQAFATSLIDQFNRRGLSEKQENWVNILIQRANGAHRAPQTAVGNVKPIVDMLEHAAHHLKWPAIQVRAGNRDLRLSIAGDRARVPGSINVTSTEKDPMTGNRDWFGRISRDGVFDPSPRFDATTQTAVAQALVALATDPAQAALEYARLTGVCCFCRLPLTDERSTAKGYGPVCAKHFGLPWGDEKPAKPAKPQLTVVKSEPAPQPMPQPAQPKKSLVELAKAMGC